MDTLVSHPLIPFISFTGSVAVGKQVEKTAAAAADAGNGFKSVGLELGGKDAAYVRAGAPLFPIFLGFPPLEGSMRNTRLRESTLTHYLPAPLSIFRFSQTATLPTPPRTLSTAPCSTLDSRAALSSVSTFKSRSTTSSSRRLSRLLRCVGSVSASLPIVPSPLETVDLVIPAQPG